jgi:hypothetical protein
VYLGYRLLCGVDERLTFQGFWPAERCFARLIGQHTEFVMLIFVSCRVVVHNEIYLCIGVYI